MKESLLTVVNETGLHSRPADLFVRTAKLYGCRITVHNGDKSADAKNIIKVILLNVKQNTQIRIEASGADEDAAIGDLTRLVQSNFKEVNDKIRI
jgi:phosphotransferase system HPr (HPr) family protein